MESDDFEISQRDINLVFQNDLERLNKRLNYLEKFDKTRYEKLLKFKNEYNNKMELLDRYSIAHNCGNSINKGRFARAAAMLQNIYTTNYDEVIHAAYDNNSDNFEKIIIFANFVGKTNSTRALILFEELFNQSKDLVGPEEIIKLVIQTQEYESPGWGNLRTKVLDLFVSKISKTITNSTFPFTEVFGNHIYSIINQINELDQEASSKLVSNIIKQVSTSGKITHVIRYVSGFHDVTLKVKSYSYLFDIIQKNMESYSPNLMYLIKYIQSTFAEPEIEENDKNKLLSLVKKFPSCLEQAAYSQSVCIQNKHSGNFLKVSKFGRDSKWWLHLSPSETAYNRTKWTFRPYYSNLFIIKNNHLGYMSLDNNEFKFTNQSFDLFKNKIYNESLWTMVVKVGDCYLKTIDKYLMDSEGDPEISLELHEFAKWVLKNC